MDVQKALNQLGYRGTDTQPLKVDGLMGNNTRLAINSYRTRKNIDPTTSTNLVYQYILADAKNPTERPGLDIKTQDTPIAPENLEGAVKTVELARESISRVISKLGKDPKLQDAYRELFPHLAIWNQPVTATPESINGNYLMMLAVKKFLTKAQPLSTDKDVAWLSGHLDELMKQVYFALGKQQPQQQSKDAVI